MTTETTHIVQETQLWTEEELLGHMNKLMAYAETTGLDVVRFYFLIRHAESTLKEILGISHIETKVMVKGGDA